jgi:hypothetical protein
MALTTPLDADYDFISPFSLAIQLGNNDDVPETGLSSRIHARDLNFDDDDSCIIITDTPTSIGDDFDPSMDGDSDFGSPTSLPRIRFMPGNVAAVADSSTTAGHRPGPHHPHGFDWSLPPPIYEAYEQDAVSSAHTTVASSPGLTASSNGQYGRSSTSTTRTFDNLLSTTRTSPRRQDEKDLSPLLPPRPSFGPYGLLSMGGSTTPCALSRPIAVDESAFSRGGRGRRRGGPDVGPPSSRSRAQEESQAASYSDFLDDVERQPRSTWEHTPDRILARLGMATGPGRPLRRDSGLPYPADYGPQVGPSSYHGYGGGV